MARDLDEWARALGTTADADLRGNLHHLISPVIGHLRVHAEEAPISRERARIMADRLYLALALADTELAPRGESQ